MYNANHRGRRYRRHDSRRRNSEVGFREVVTKLASNPVAKYVATGLASLLLAQLARKASKKYPEISQFIDDSVGMFEDNMANMRYEMQEGLTGRH